MATSVLEQYRISDFLEWHEKKSLTLNPHFQRRNVWNASARSYLIDTILRRLPIPKFYIRTRVDLATKKSFREVVDGQQRLRAIIDFAQNKYALTSRAKEYAGLKYETLSDEQKESFLSYALSVDQLINASDDDVLEIFARLNSYNVVLNPPELRHAKFQGQFKWAVYDAARRWEVLWDLFDIVSVRERLRMQDVSLMAEMFGILLEGVKDGGQLKITKLYERFDREFPQELEIVERLDSDLQFIADELTHAISGPIANAPHFLMLFAAVAFCRHGIPAGEMGVLMPGLPAGALTNIPQAVENIAVLGNVISEGVGPDRLNDFVEASSSSTQRISSRRRRFPIFVEALDAEPI